MRRLVPKASFSFLIRLMYMKRNLVTKIIILISFFFLAFQNIQDYRRIHFDAVVFDGHNDVVQRLLTGENLSVRTEKGHIDIPRLKEGGIDAAFFAVWVPPGNKSKPYFDQANQQIDTLMNFVKNNYKEIELARSYNELVRINRDGKIALMISMEGAHPIGDDLQKLDYYYKKGVRSIMVTWNNSTNWATSSVDETQSPEKIKKKGLTKLGKKFIDRMDELGILIDVSHAGEATFWDIIKISKNPIIASHSSVYTICPHHRNLKDDQIKAIAASNGLVAITFVASFLDSTFTKREQIIRKRYDEEIDSLRRNWKGSGLAREEAIGRMLKLEYDKIKPSVSTLVDHIDYVVKLVGVDYVALGSDFDGIGVAPKGLDDVSQYPEITKELLRRGYNETEIKKILGGNFLRVLKTIDDRKTKPRSN